MTVNMKPFGFENLTPHYIPATAGGVAGACRQVIRLTSESPNPNLAI